MKNFLSLTAISLILSTQPINLSAKSDVGEVSSHNLQGNVVKVSNPQMVVEGEKSYMRFNYFSGQKGQFYLHFWMLPVADQNENFLPHAIRVNGVEVSDKIVPTKKDWQLLSFEKKSPISLCKGCNVIEIESSLPVFPMVESLFISEAVEYDTINFEYDKYLELAEKCGSESYGRKIVDKPIIINPKDTAIQAISSTPFSYSYELSAPLNYTYNSWLYYRAGETIKVSTNSSTETSHRVNIFNPELPQHSWTCGANENNGYSTDFSVVAPVSGYYKLIVRSSNNDEMGVCDVTLNGSTTYKNVPISMHRFVVSQPINKVVNSFTAYSTSKSAIWIEEGLSGKIISYNELYHWDGDYEWGDNARIRKRYDTPTKNVFVMSTTSETPIGSADIYVGCPEVLKDDDMNVFFPSLKEDDCMESAVADTSYNCIGWAGGLLQWCWPTLYLKSYEGVVTGPTAVNEPDPAKQLEWFDEFFGTERYPGAPIYSREGATESNSVIDLLGVTGPNYNGIFSDINDVLYYTHASVRKGSDGNPHGYDWESKIGALRRVFHPRYALCGPMYGQILHHYRLVSAKNKIGLLEEAVANGTAIIDNPKFDVAEIAAIDTEISRISPVVRQNFYELYTAWEEKCKGSFSSNPQILRQYDEYVKLLDFCRTNSYGNDINVLMFKMLSLNRSCAIIPIADFVIPQSVDQLKEVVSYLDQTKQNSSGSKIIRSPHSEFVYFVKYLLSPNIDIATLFDGEDMDSEIDGSSVDITSYDNILNVLVDIKDAANVSVSVLDENGNVVSEENFIGKQESGKYTLVKEIKKSGIYFIRVIIDGRWTVKKILF